MLLPYNERAGPDALAPSRRAAPPRRWKWIGTITGGGASRLASAKFSPTLRLCPPLTFRSYHTVPSWLSLARDAQWYFGN